MGVVYAARDLELEREVALKVVAADVADAETIARLRREARIIAHLEHPGIVPVHDVGALPDGRVFYAMKLVTGKRLDAQVREARRSASGSGSSCASASRSRSPTPTASSTATSSPRT